MEKAGKAQAKDLCPVLTSRAKETPSVHALVVDKAAPKAAVALIAKIALALTTPVVPMYLRRKGKRSSQVLLP